MRMRGNSFSQKCYVRLQLTGEEFWQLSITKFKVEIVTQFQSILHSEEPGTWFNLKSWQKQGWRDGLVLRTLVPENQGLVPSIHVAAHKYLKLKIVPGDRTLSSGLSKPWACTWYTDTHRTTHNTQK